MLAAFDGFFLYARQRLMLLASNKVDARLGSRTFAHLLSLPLSFFETHAAGVLVRHMQQTEKLRHFLTGRLFQTLLDAALLPVLLVLLALYSGVLTLVVLGFSRGDRGGDRRHGAGLPAAAERAVCGRGRAPGASGRDAAQHARGEVAGAGTGAPARLGRPGGDRRARACGCRADLGARRRQHRRCWNG